MMSSDTLRQSIALKLDLLASGLRYDSDFLRWYGERTDLIERRRAYGSGDKVRLPTSVRVPPEVVLPGGVVAAVNYSPDAPRSLELVDGAPMVRSKGDLVPVEFAPRPAYYGRAIANGTPVERIVTLYGTGTIGLFSPAHCYYFNDDRQCRFCSLGPTRSAEEMHAKVIVPAVAKEAVKLALELASPGARHILLNGGTIPDYDLGFEKHLRVLEAIAELSLPSGVGLRLISMPPRNLRLFERLRDVGATIAMSIEVFDPEHFARICPGKDQDYGRLAFLDAFAAASDTLGRGRVYAGFVAGIEPAETLREGMHSLAKVGAAPAVNVFHPDAGSLYAEHPRPDVEFLSGVLRDMTAIYTENSFVPFIEGSGRNSMDTEAFLGVWTGKSERRGEALC